MEQEPKTAKARVVEKKTFVLQEHLAKTPEAPEQWKDVQVVGDASDAVKVAKSLGRSGTFRVIAVAKPFTITIEQKMVATVK